jgi:hypothetical protein
MTVLYFKMLMKKYFENILIRACSYTGRNSCGFVLFLNAF